jgi:Domain of unknown function (DUF4276)
MALVIRVGFFCSGGDTELGARGFEPAAIDAFLRKIGADIAWVRAFPAFEKPGPKLGRARTSLKDSRDGGITGSGLIDKMRDRLEKHYRGPACDFDVIVLVDDADCRFLQEGSLEDWTEDVERKVRAWTEQPDLRFVALLASPEIEAWLLADWEEGFGREYRPIQVPLGRGLASDQRLGKRPWTSIESFGGPYANGSCSRKLSDEVQDLVKENGGTYSKRNNGPDMLRRIRPDDVAQVCRSVFAHALRKIRELADTTAIMSR